MTSLYVNLLEPLLPGKIQTPNQKEASLLRAHGLVEWLLVYHFPSKIRKSSLPIFVISPSRGQVQIQLQITNDTVEGDEESHNWDKSTWEKAIRTTLKKIHVEDLGNMNAVELKTYIPEHDSEGRGMTDLYKLEKKMTIKVVFDTITGHVLLVGDVKKLEKKVFVIRNMLSHYHWRLSGSDVAFDKATSSR